MTAPEKFITEFLSIAKLAGVNIPQGAVWLETLHKPHTPQSVLPQGSMAVYVFLWGDHCLKVGKIGPKSQARYMSQHYNPNSSSSNLAKSILRQKFELGFPHLTETNVGDWIKQNTDRINFLLDQNLGISVLSLMEAFLQCRLKPKFEGFESQK